MCVSGSKSLLLQTSRNPQLDEHLFWNSPKVKWSEFCTFKTWNARKIDQNNFESWRFSMAIFIHFQEEAINDRCFRFTPTLIQTFGSRLTSVWEVDVAIPRANTDQKKIPLAGITEYWLISAANYPFLSILVNFQTFFELFLSHFWALEYWLISAAAKMHFLTS